MIRLKHLLFESDGPIDWHVPFSLSPNDPWEYLNKPEDNKLYTRKRGTTKWIDMQSVLTPGQYDKAYRRIKDIVSGLKKSGVQTGNDSGLSLKMEKILSFIKTNTQYTWETGHYNQGEMYIETIGKNGEVIACAGAGQTNTKGRVSIHISFSGLTIIVPTQYKWDATKILNKIGNVDWDPRHSMQNGKTVKVTGCKNHPMNNKDFVAWHYDIDILRRHKEVVVALNLMSKWNAVDKKK